MARPLLDAAPPAWFKLSHYDEAADMDAADWLLNLAIRGEIARHTALSPKLLREVRAKPVVLRARDAQVFLPRAYIPTITT